MLSDSRFLVHAELLREKVSSFEEYPFCLPAVKRLEILEFHSGVTFLVGENGTGKSTLLEGIAVALGLNAEGGSRNFNFETRASHSRLWEFLRLRRGMGRSKDCWFLRAESFFNLATEIERLDEIVSSARPVIDSYGGNSLHEQSHGESFFALFKNRFGGKGLYILDEPEAALSPMRQMAFLTLMHDLVVEGSQFIVATHSPIIMAYPQSWIYRLGAEGIKRVEYKETENYRITREFLNCPEKMLGILMERKEEES